MRNRVVAVLGALAAAVACAAGVVAKTTGQAQTPDDARGARAGDLTRYPLTPWGLEKFKANKPAHGEHQVAESNDPTNKCFPLPARRGRT
jgi:hypothetical protein